MLFLIKFGSRSRRSGVALLLVGVLAGVATTGGIEVIAASSTKTVTVCANKKTKMLRYAKNKKCAKTETKVVLNQTANVVGAPGARGVDGTNGTNGAVGAVGAKGDVGPAGTASPTGFTTRSVCGANGTTLCAVGKQGPGGGTVFYVDTDNEIAGYDYLEVAPTDASISIPWSTGTSECGTSIFGSCLQSYISDAGSALNYVGIGSGKAATAAIVARHNAGAVARDSYAAGAADAYSTSTASDWWLPSKDELTAVCKYARNTPQAAGGTEECFGGTTNNDFSPYYWSSSEYIATAGWLIVFTMGSPTTVSRSQLHAARPVRGF